MSCINEATRECLRWRTGSREKITETRRQGESVVYVFCFDFQFLLTGFADPVMFSVDEGVIVDTFPVVVGTQIAFHYWRYLLSEF